MYYVKIILLVIEQLYKTDLNIRFILVNILYVFIIINIPLNSEDNFVKKLANKFSNKKENLKVKQKKKLLTIIGVDNKEVLNAINNQLTVDLQNPTQIERNFWINYNTNELYKILYSYGYFDATVNPLNNKTIKKFKINLNKRYKLNKLICTYNDYKEYRAGLTINQVFNIIGVKQNSDFSTKKVSSGIGNLKDFYRKRGFAFVTIEKPDIEVDSSNKTVTAIYNINLGSKTTINNTIINIQSKKDPKLLEKFIKNRINWKKNDVYNIDTFNKFKEDLVKYDLFSTIDVNAKEPLPYNDNNIYTTSSDIIVDLKEAMLREIKFGIKFNTTDLFGLQFDWKHHNIDGKGSNISFISNLDKNTPSIILQHNTYDILLPRQCLSTQVFGLIKKFTSYNINKIGVESILWQSITRYLEVGLGASWEKSKTIDKVLTENEEKGEYINIFGIPMELKFDNTDNFLDPQKGIRFNLRFNPCFLNKTNYNVILGKLSTYIGFKTNDEFRNKLVIAIYSKYGTIINRNNIEIPRSKFFFSGGMDSIRGYGNGKVGQLDNKTRKPTGGTSLFEIGIEPRFRLNNNMCLTAFIEAGAVFNKSNTFNTKSIFKELMYGYGVGLIYYTPIAPIRINIAFPTKRRKKNNKKYVDSAFQLYISVGQAF